MDLSIVIPCYNSEKYLNSCLKSVCDQIQNKKIEVLIVDDASKDKTSQIINSYKKKVKFIEIFKNKKNSGVSVSRNLALRKAKGKYILFLDSDDEIIKDSISQLLNYINKNYVDVVILRNTWRLRFGGSKNALKSDRNRSENNVLTGVCFEQKVTNDSPKS